MSSPPTKKISFLLIAGNELQDKQAVIYHAEISVWLLLLPFNQLCTQDHSKGQNT